MMELSPGTAVAAGAQQRNLERLPLTMNVLLIARGMNRRSGLMKDICSGGALIEMRDTAAAEDRQLTRGDVILIRMFLGVGGEVREHELRARIAHIDKNLFGVSFFNPDDNVMAALLKSAEQEAVAHSSVMSVEAKALVERLGQEMLAYCRDAMASFFKQADEGLLQAADHARSNTDQRLYFEAATALRKQSEVVRSRFITDLKASFLQLYPPH